ncbi:juvenile hormone acid O-methyltransferase-like [Phlebotomus argentipes]|uniref:juvenile hormone acid O-methyltransferase-like n=1 Tax=Phlebotomus argentipes TaxID=94469 RepID=UPI0028930A0D|nr:juvenile hormone acid O-methyltransferase-like [Phlebotomus argentipes]
MNVNQNNYNIEQFSVATSFRELGIKFYAERILKQLKWRGGERVLDIGCGPGDVTKNCIYSFLPQNFGKLVCADISPEMLKACKSKFTGIENVEFLEMDIMKTPEQSMKGTFDRILSMYCFMYVSDQKKALQNVFDLLKPGGDCWILQVTSTPLVSPIFTLAKTPKWKDKLANFRDFYVYQFYEDPNPIENGETYMKSVGFTDVSVNLDRVYNQMESLESYKGDTEHNNG